MGEVFAFPLVGEVSVEGEVPLVEGETDAITFYKNLTFKNWEVMEDDRGNGVMKSSGVNTK